jgi:ATP-dependent Clp protease ATP-binding subunit ClpA
MIKALSAYTFASARDGQMPSELGLEVLLSLVLAHADEQDRQFLRPLDTGAAAGLFREQVVRQISEKAGHNGSNDGAQVSPESESTSILPVGLCPSEDLTALARVAGSAGPFPFDDAKEFDGTFDELARILHRSHAHHVLMVGERGVGKSTVLLEFARRAAAGQPSFLANKRIVCIDCRYVCPEDSRRALIAILNQVGERRELVVAIDGLASLLRSERGNSNKAVLFAGLARLRCRIIGLLTPHECGELIADDPDFCDFFGTVEVDEPQHDTAVKLLRHFARGLEHRFQVVIDDEAVREAVSLSTTYILNDQLPAKALKILHDACEEIDFERSQHNRQRDRVTIDDVVRRVSELSGVPGETLRGIGDNVDYAAALGELIFGQPHAVKEVATELGLIKAGMTDANKPASVMMFLGQTGVGKTEMAKALARFYSTSKRLKTYTLGNCIEPHSVSTIIGVPPGYVGADRGGPLVNDLNSDPYCVFLLDEADKAHPDVLQPFLNLFDEGWVSDQRGAKGYANKAIFILTSNVGQRMIADMVEQKKSIEEITARMREALSQIRHTKSDRPVFTPEFLARLKRVIVFGSLDNAAMQGIARKLLRELCEQWQTKRGKRLEIPEALVQFVADESSRRNEKSKGKEGGRIVRKLISEWIEAKLQREISRQLDAYRACNRIVLAFTPPSPPGDGHPMSTVEIDVHFASDAADDCVTRQES